MPPRKLSKASETSRRSIIEAVTTPLAFFVLTLLVSESVLGVVFLRAGSELGRGGVFAAMFVLLVALVGIVAFFAHSRPEVLYGRRPPASPIQLTTGQHGSGDYDLLLGEWFEEIPKSPDRRYSVGMISFDTATKDLHFDGANYQTDGQRFCTWRSVLVHCKPQERELFYIFDACIDGELNTTNTGFGVLQLETVKPKGLRPVSGYYIEARPDGKPYTHSMQPLREVALSLGIADNGEDRVRFHRRVISAYEQQRTNVA